MSDARMEFIGDPTGGIIEQIKKVTGQDDVITFFIRGPGGELIARKDAGGLLYYHYDWMGNTRLLTGTDGSVTDEYTYGDVQGINVTHTIGSTQQPFIWGAGSDVFSNIHDPGFQLVQVGTGFHSPQIGTGSGPYNRFGFIGQRGLSQIFLTPKSHKPIKADGGREMTDFEQFKDRVRSFDAVRTISDYAAVWGDTLTFNGTGWIRDQLGVNWVVNENSWAYRGGQLTGIVHGIALGKAAAANFAGGEAVNLELQTHHIVEQRNAARFGAYQSPK